MGAHATEAARDTSALAKPSSLRRRILAFVTGLVLVSLLGSTVSVYRITEVNRLLDAINRVSVPLGRLFAQMQSDADVFRREMERSLGYSHWKDPRWKPRPIPRWIQDILQSETERIRELVKTDSAWASDESRRHWLEWADNIHRGLAELKDLGVKLYQALEQRDENAAAELYPRWNAALEEWQRQLQWGTAEYERVLRQTFALADARTSELRTGLEVVLAVVVILSLLLLWLGERALRPLGELTSLARNIRQRGLRKEDRALMPEISLNRKDEVSELAREFQRMALALLEREKIVDSQKSQLQEQNRLLRSMGELNQNVLNSIDSALIVTDPQGRITHCNPVAVRWLGADEKAELAGKELLKFPRLQAFIDNGAGKLLERIATLTGAARIEPVQSDGRVFGGHLMPLRQENGSSYGAIWAFDDLTEETDLQKRLTRAENLATVGRMSAQVAHEVRNPLHSIGLEAEMAAELAAQLGHLPLKQSLQSILASVDRLEKITQNYLKLSRLSSGQKSKVDLGEVLDAVLATYASTCEAEGVRVDWKRESSEPMLILCDRDLLEQALGNLFKNALQALQCLPPGAPRRVTWSIGHAESGRVWLRIEDNGPGLAAEVRDKLFTPFVTTRSAGTGLGLSFVKKVVEDHGGIVNFVEPRGGQGASFELYFPVLAERAKQSRGMPVTRPEEQVHG